MITSDYLEVTCKALQKNTIHDNLPFPKIKDQGSRYAGNSQTPDWGGEVPQTSLEARRNGP